MYSWSQTLVEVKTIVLPLHRVHVHSVFASSCPSHIFPLPCRWQLYRKTSPSSSAACTGLSTCLEEIREWINQNFLPAKPQQHMLYCGTPHKWQQSPLTHLTVAGQNIPLPPPSQTWAPSLIPTWTLKCNFYTSRTFLNVILPLPF